MLYFGVRRYTYLHMKELYKQWFIFRFLYKKMEVASGMYDAIKEGGSTRIQHQVISLRKISITNLFLYLLLITWFSPTHSFSTLDFRNKLSRSYLHPRRLHKIIFSKKKLLRDWVISNLQHKFGRLVTEVKKINTRQHYRFTLTIPIHFHIIPFRLIYKKFIA